MRWTKRRRARSANGYNSIPSTGRPCARWEATMATAPSDRRPVNGRLDAQDRLVSADPELAALQIEAGSHVGAELALPQLISIARLARKLGVPIYRNATAAGAEQDVDLLVRAI